MLEKVLASSSSKAARQLLGCFLERTLDGKIVRVKIVETEAYDQTDAASHSFNGRTPRTDVMFGPAGRLYVYFTYGMHYCCNVVVGKEGVGSAVLIRAVEPLAGEEIMQKRRGNKTDSELTNGPAKVCQALAIDKQLNGHNLEDAPLRLVMNEPLEEKMIATGPRIGISKAKDVPWRFYIRDNSFVSR